VKGKASIRASRHIVGFVASRGDEVVMIESSPTVRGGFDIRSRGLRPEYQYRCGSVKLMTIFLMEIHTQLTGKGWVLTPIRALE
jgi:hypothetical protein